MKASNSPSKGKANQTARESPLRAILERESNAAEVAATKQFIDDQISLQKKALKAEDDFESPIAVAEAATACGN